jgi:arsenate reductase
VRASIRAGRVQPLAAEFAIGLGYPAERMRSKAWDEFARPGVPAMDFVITVCDNAAGEACPVSFGLPVSAHWGVPDPARVAGDELKCRAAYRDAAGRLRRRIEAMTALSDEWLAGPEVRDALQEIGRMGTEPQA